MGKKRIAWLDYISALGLAVVGCGLLTQSQAVSQGVKAGLDACAGVLIPALFPFMVLSGFLSLSGAADILSIPLAPVTAKIFKLPKELGAIILLSMIGGYPVGAKNIALLLSQKKITEKTAERMLCFCVNSGPSFLIAAVGAGMLFSKTAGIILFATQTAATLLIGAAVSFREKAPKLENAGVKIKGTAAFVSAVAGASSAMIAMCSYAVLFAGLLALVSNSGIIHWAARFLSIPETVIRAAASGFLEVTSGCVAASRLGGGLAFGMISAFVSFGGLSVLFQIMSCFHGYSVRFKPLILSRISHMFLSTAMAVPLYRVFCDTRQVFAGAAAPAMHVNTHTIIISGCLLCMCAILTLSGFRQ